MKRRKVSGELTAAEFVRERPTFIPPVKNFRGPRRAGLVYEHKVGTHLRARYEGDALLVGPWFAFTDRRGKGWCQPDFVVRLHGVTIIGECKLQWRKGAEWKLEGLYKPVVEKALGPGKYILVQVCRTLSRSFQGELLDNWDDVVNHQFPYSVLMWRL